jgi:hypothetical protein
MKLGDATTCHFTKTQQNNDGTVVDRLYFALRPPNPPVSFFFSAAATLLGTTIDKIALSWSFVPIEAGSKNDRPPSDVDIILCGRLYDVAPGGHGIIVFRSKQVQTSHFDSRIGSRKGVATEDRGP